MRRDRVHLAALIGLAASAASSLAANGEPVRVTNYERVCAPRDPEIVLDEVPIETALGSRAGYDDSGSTRFKVLILPPYPVYAYVVPGGTIVKDEMMPLYSDPTERRTTIDIGPDQYNPGNGDRLFLFWSEEETVATPWAEVYQDGGGYKLRAPPESMPSDLTMTVRGRHDRTPGSPEALQ